MPVKCRGAEAGTRTRMGCPTRPSNVRVYQFHHFGMAGIKGRGQNGCQSTSPSIHFAELSACPHGQAWKAEHAMERLTIIQTVVEMTRAKTYLEIGVDSGAVFFRVKARYKIAVDPRFEFSTMKQLRYLIKNPWNIGNNTMK